MRRNTLLFHALLLSLIALSLFTGYSYRGLQTEQELEQVIEWNTKQIHSIAVVSATESFEADCLLQILHALNGEEFEVPPKERIVETLEYNDVYPQDKELPATFEQVNKDQKEVDQCIRGFGSGNLFQAETLIHILEKLKNKNGDSIYKFTAKN